MMSLNQQELATLIGDVLEVIARLGFSAPSLDRLYTEDLVRARQRHHYVTQRRAGLIELFVTLPGREVSHRILRMRRGLPPSMERFVEVRFLARLVSPFRLLDARTVHEVAALAVLSGRQERVSNRRWWRELWREIEPLDRGWYRAHRSTLRAACRGVTLALYGDSVLGEAREHRDAGRHDEAEAAYRKAARIGHAAHRVAIIAASFLGRGKVMMNRGKMGDARVLFLRALTIARRCNLRTIEAYTLHDLFWHAWETGDPETAGAYANAAFQVYGSDHPSLPTLSHDIAVFWIEQGHFRPGIEVAAATLRHATNPRQRVLGFGTLCRALGGDGEKGRYARTLHSLERALLSYGGVGAGDALLDAARGALLLSDFELAADLSGRAMGYARSLGAGKLSLEIDAFADSLLTERAICERRDSRLLSGSAPEAKWNAQARAIVAALRRRPVETGAGSR